MIDNLKNNTCLGDTKEEETLKAFIKSMKHGADTMKNY